MTKVCDYQRQNLIAILANIVSLSQGKSVETTTAVQPSMQQEQTAQVETDAEAEAEMQPAEEVLADDVSVELEDAPAAVFEANLETVAPETMVDMKTNNCFL